MMKLQSILAIVSVASGWALAMCNAAAQEPCKLTPMGVAKATAVRDGRTLLLEDGRELRLAAIEAGDASDDALRRLIGGQALRLEQQNRKGEEFDRYGRLLAFAYAGDAQQSLQQGLLEQGLAQVSARAGGRACAEALLTAERAARAAR